MAKKPWWQFPVTRTQAQGDPGVDIATPFHTAITALLGGTVEQVTTGPWGQEVDILGPNGTTEAYVHLDVVAQNIVSGAQITAGELLGWSGGQLQGGLHPASSAYSSGPHTEFDIFAGTPWQSQEIDPLPILAKLGAAANAGGAAIGTAATASGSGIQQLLQQLLGGVAQENQVSTAALNPANWAGAIGSGLALGVQALGQTFLQSLGVSSLKDLAFRSVLIIGGIIILLIVIVALLFENTKQDVKAFIEGGGAAKVAAA